MAASLVNNKYRITRRIGGGSFGEIYMGIGPSGEKVAVKFERHATRCPQLRHEYKVYREITGCHGFASVYYFGQQDNYNVMVMDLLGPSLEDLFNKCNRRFSLKTVLQLADQLLERVDTLHARHLIHRDIKPANFVIGLGEQGNNIYCVDFGLSKRYRHPKNLQHIPHRDGRSLTGTPRYASINNHLGVEQSRRDDLESIGYVLIYFLKGSLPWQGLKARNAQKKYRLILEKKQSVSIAQLCQGCPAQFAEFLAYSRSLKFDAKPDVPYLRKMFRDLYHAQGCGSQGKTWDWDPVDADYMASGSGSAAAAPDGGGEGAGAGLRPTTAGAVASGRPQSGWGYGGRPQSGNAVKGAEAAARDVTMGDYSGQGGGGGGGQIGFDTGMRATNRPHTAGYVGRSSGGAMRGQPSGQGQEGEDAHVVAGARAMMKYRRTRTSDGAEGEYMPSGQPQGNTGRGSSAKPPPGWMASVDRPKSAGVANTGFMSGLVGVNRGTNGAQSGQVNTQGQVAGQGQDGGHSYGSLKNRFLSGGNGQKKSGSASGSNSKLFSLSR